VGDHVQTAGEAQHNLIVAYEVAHDPPDRDWRSPMALEATAVLGGAVDAVADGGHDPGPAVKPCLPAGMTPASARPIPSAQQ
jgi:hypothetical protein